MNFYTVNQFNQENQLGFQCDSCLYPAPCTLQSHISSGFSSSHDNFSQENSHEDSISYSPFDPATCNGLYAVGKLYADQAYSNATPAQKIVLSIITDFCGSDFAKQHNGAINLKNWAISNRSDGLFNPVQISRHIQALKQKNLINVITGNGDRWISVNKDALGDKKFLPIFALKDIKLTHSETLMLSILTNAACVYARSDIGFVLPSNSVKNICKMLAFTDSLGQTTVKRTLNSLESKGLITKDYSNSDSYIINQVVAERYAALFNVSLSEKASFLLNKRAFNSVVSYIDNPLTRTIRAKRSELISNSCNAIDVVKTYEGTVVIEAAQYTDTDGTVQNLDSNLPFYEKSLSQHVVPRLNESYSLQSSTVGDVRYHEVERSAFYSLSDLGKWHVTLDEALDDHQLAHEATEVNSFSSNQLKQLILNGVADQANRKRFRPKQSKNVQGTDKKCATPESKNVQPQAEKCAGIGQKTSHIKNEEKNENKNEKKNEKKNDAHSRSLECASCNDVASLALGESNTVTAETSGVHDLASAVEYMTALAKTIKSPTPDTPEDVIYHHELAEQSSAPTEQIANTPDSDSYSQASFTGGEEKKAAGSDCQPPKAVELTVDDVKDAAMVAIAMRNISQPKSNGIRPQMSFSEIIRSMASVRQQHKD